MTAGTMWWVVAGVLVAAELVTGTFFLLMLALGAAAGALAALLGWAQELQISAAAVVGGCAVALWYLRIRQRHAGAGHTPLGAHRDPDVTLDLGQTVQVTHWADDHSTQVQYRGAVWTARPQPTVPTPLTPGPYRIAAMQGNVLLLDKV